MGYKKEFYDYDGELFMPDGKGWSDSSWHNDVCPKVTKFIDKKETLEVIIWQNYVNPDLREVDWGTRYSFVIESCDTYDVVFSSQTDSIEDIKTLIQSVNFE